MHLHVRLYRPGNFGLKLMVRNLESGWKLRLATPFRYQTDDEDAAHHAWAMSNRFEFWSTNSAHWQQAKLVVFDISIFGFSISLTKETPFFRNSSEG